MIKRLKKKHKVLCTTRRYAEATRLGAIRRLDMVSVGTYGYSREEKLEKSIDRMAKLYKIVTKFSPDLLIDSCTPDATRIAFGLGIRHIGFHDTPHAYAVIRLAVPLVDKLLIPSAIPKSMFTKFGIDKKDIITHNSIDAALTIKRRADKRSGLPFRSNGKKNILIRMDERHASYAKKSDDTMSFITKIVEQYGQENIVVLCRYSDQMRHIREKVGYGCKVTGLKYDGKYLLENTDVFVGSGGTMTAEAALMGVPTISYDAVPNVIQDYLVRKRVVTKATSPKDVARHVEKALNTPAYVYRKRAKNLTRRMEDPFIKLEKLL